MNVKVKVPTTLSELTLSQYQKYLKIQSENEDNTFVAQKMIEIFCDLPLDKVIRMKWRDVKEITEELGELFDKESTFIKKFTYKNQNYGFIPNLDEISFGEFVDLDSCLQDWQRMHHAMQILYRPIDIQVRGRYNIKDYDGVLDEKMKDIPLNIALGSVFFFVEFRQRVVGSYDGLFQQGDTGGTFTSEGGFNAKWSWYQSFFEASQGDIRRFEDISKLRLHKVLMYLEYITEKATLENQRLKRNYGR